MENWHWILVALILAIAGLAGAAMYRTTDYDWCNLWHEQTYCNRVYPQYKWDPTPTPTSTPKPTATPRPR